MEYVIKLNQIGSSNKLIEFVDDRLGHDFRYAINSNKIQMTGWTCEFDFEESLQKTVEWYLDNQEWMNRITSGVYLQYYKKMYN